MRPAPRSAAQKFQVGDVVRLNYPPDVTNYQQHNELVGWIEGVVKLMGKVQYYRIAWLNNEYGPDTGENPEHLILLGHADPK